MKKIAIGIALLFTLTGCGGGYGATNSENKKDIDGTECVIVTSSAGSVAVDCDWNE